MKTYKTYNARNAVKAALVTNHIKAQKKLGVSHSEAKAEAYRLYNIKAGLPILRKHFSRNENKSPVVKFPPLPTLPKMPAPPMPPIRMKLPNNHPFPVLPPLPQASPQVQARVRELLPLPKVGE